MKHGLTIGSALLAIAASACCWLPWLLVALGATAVAVGAVFASLRPYLLVSAGLLLAFGFHLNNRAGRTECAADGSCPVPKRRAMESLSRGGLWLSALLLLASALFPKFAGNLIAGPSARPTDPREASALVLDIEGMTCAGCEPTVEAVLGQVPGVTGVEASFATHQAIVSVERRSAPSQLALSTALGGLGYRVVAVEQAAKDHGSPLAGHWVGTEPLDDAQTPSLVMDLDRMGERWVGEFDVEAFGVQDYPVQVQINDQQITLVFTAAAAEFKGRLLGDGLSGTLDFDGRKIDVEFRRTGKAVFSSQFLELEAAAADSTRVQTLSADGNELRARFNADRNKTRLIMLLAPS